jgi:hypothetical protein
VFLSSNAIITIGGILSASPAANIIHENPVSGTTYLLETSSSSLITENFDKFLYNGAAGHIDDTPISETYYGQIAWYGVYK